MRHVGESVGLLLLNQFQSVDQLVDAEEEEILSIPGVGPEIAASVRAYFEADANRGLVENLKSAGLKMALEGKESEPEETFSDKTFVVTGTLQKFTRKGIKEFIRQRGGKVTSSVTAKTDYLLVGDKPGSKLQKARDMGVTIMSEDELSQYEGPPG